MTAPVTDFEVVFAKWLGAVVLYTLMWALTGLYVLILQHFSQGTAMLDLGPIASGVCRRAGHWAVPDRHRACWRRR